MKLNVVVGIIIQDTQVLVCQRPAHLQHGSQWEFPGGKIGSNEPLMDALQRELFEEVGITVLKAQHFYSTGYQYPDKYVHLECFLVTKFLGLPHRKEGQPQLRWADVKRLPQYDFPEANFQIIDQILGFCRK